MTKWRVDIPIGTTVFVTVEAEDAELAIEAAYEDVPSLCAQCTGWGRTWGRDEWEPDWENAAAEAIEEDA